MGIRRDCSQHFANTMSLNSQNNTTENVEAFQDADNVVFVFNLDAGYTGKVQYMKVHQVILCSFSICCTLT